MGVLTFDPVLWKVYTVIHKHLGHPYFRIALLEPEAHALNV